MIYLNGANVAPKLISNYSKTARGFFDLFYQFNKIGCAASLKGRRQCHSSTHKLSQSTSQCSTPTFAWNVQRSSKSTAATPSLVQNSLAEPRLSTELRRIMRATVHSVVVLTTTTGPASTPIFRGMTLSSFTTLTLTPSPIVTFNIRRPSRTLDAIRDSKHFLIHMLSATESGAGVANEFTQGNIDTEGNERDVFNSSKFVIQHDVVKPSGNGNTTLERLVLPMMVAKGITKVLRCEVLNTSHDLSKSDGLVEVGDHVLILAKVLDILGSPGKGRRSSGTDEEDGLCYANGKYRKHGQVIDPQHSS
ncbi:flavin reductase like domain-containing protein [Xylogone sp. PMI_703]|nr:flavin reductase like domain-containing protein [Xylogone sp. PMI_703]